MTTVITIVVVALLCFIIGAMIGGAYVERKYNRTKDEENNK